MERVFQGLRPLIRWVVRRAGVVLLLALGFSAVGVYFASQLRIDTDLTNLIPADYPSVQALERLRATVGGESEAAVGIVSPSFEANRAFAEALIPRALALIGEGQQEPYFRRVEYRRDNVEFLQDNALYFASPAELDELEGFLLDQIEEAKLAANPFFTDFGLDDEDDAAASDSTAASLQAVYDEIVAKEYPISDDSTTMALRFYPAGAQTNLGFIERAYADLEALIVELDPASYHPEMEVTTAGRLLRQLTEVQAVSNDVLQSFGAGMVGVLLLVVLYFLYKSYRARAGLRMNARILLSEMARTPVMALVIGLPLLMSLTWTFGVAYLAFETLNLMTSTLGLVLFGLGIDYGIHFYARYSEERAHGRSVSEAAEVTFSSTGQAIAVGALTTAAALYVVVVADFRGFSEFGFIAGTGILFALVAMLLVMPALITLFERFRLLNLQAAPGTEGVVMHTGRRYPAAKGIVLASVALVIASLMLLPRVSFEFEFGKLEPVYEAYNARRDVVRRVFSDGNKRNPAYVVVDAPEEADAVVAAVRRHAAADTLSPTILSVESLQDRFPMNPADQQRKLARIADVRALLEDKYLTAEPSEDLDRLRRAAQTRTAIALDQVPAFLRERFTSKTGEIGNFVIIYPSVGLSDGRNSIAFAEDVGTIVTEDGTVYHAGSTSLVGADMLRLLLSEAPWMMGVTFLIVALLMWLNFRSLRWAAIATVPLVVGLLWMLLMLELLGLKVNFYNIIVLPAILGIGNDAGVHLVHRYRELGFGSIREVLRTTGEHVTMGSLTTMMGFAGLLLSFHPGLKTIGSLAVIGIGTTLAAALFFLPSLLQWREDRTQAETILQEKAAAVAEVVEG